MQKGPNTQNSEVIQEQTQIAEQKSEKNQLSEKEKQQTVIGTLNMSKVEVALFSMMDQSTQNNLFQSIQSRNSNNKSANNYTFHQEKEVSTIIVDSL